MSLHSDNILLIKITTKKSTGFRCFSFAQKEETHGNQNQQRNSQLQGDCLLRSDSAAAYLFAAGGGYGGGGCCVAWELFETLPLIVVDGGSNL